MKYMSEKAVDSFHSLHWLLFKLDLVEQYYKSERIVLLLSKLENELCIMDHV